MQYRSEATSVEGFVQQFACCYLRHGYWFYVTGRIPDRKSPEDVDRKLIEKYGIAVSESNRARRKRLGQANLQYLRFFIILATHGTHRFFDEEADSIRDIRRVVNQTRKGAGFSALPVEVVPLRRRVVRPYE
jgi:hypothetical protein